MKLLYTVLGGLLTLLVFVFGACKEDVMDIKRVSFVQVSNNLTPEISVETTKLRALLKDIEPTATDNSTIKIGHVYAKEADLAILNDTYTSLDQLDDATTTSSLRRIEGERIGIPIVNGTLENHEFISSIDNDNDLEPDNEYYYRAYTVRPHDDTLRMSPPITETGMFTVESVRIILEVLEVKSLEMKVTATCQITGGDRVEIEEYGYRLIETNTNTEVDKIVFDDFINNENERPLFAKVDDFRYFEVDRSYDVEPFVCYKLDSQQLECDQEFIGDKMSFEHDGNIKDFWINTSLIRKQDTPFVDPPDELKGTVSFPQDDIFYIGLGQKMDGSPNTDFWKFDTRFYTWEKADDWSFSGGLVDGVHTQNGNFAYAGLGHDDNGDHLSFYRKSMSTGSSGWNPITVDFHAALVGSGFDTMTVGNNLILINESVTISAEALELIIARDNAFSYGRSGSFYFGGGKGTVWERVTGILPDDGNFTSPMLPDLPIPIPDKRWLDFNDDGKIDGGQWVDKNGDGEINSTIPALIGVSVNVEGVVGNMVIESGIDEIHPYITIPDNLPSLLYRSEWYDDDFNNEVEVVNEDDIEEMETMENSVKDDLWSWGWGNNGPTDLKLESVNERNRRYGATVAYADNEIYLLGGIDSLRLGMSPVFAENSCLDGFCGDAFMELPPLLFGFSFTIVENGPNLDNVYYGGGENIGGVLNPINTRYFDSSIGGMPEFVTGCGVAQLSKGLAFSQGKKGFIGLGVTESDLINTLWMYISPD